MTILLFAVYFVLFLAGAFAAVAGFLWAEDPVQFAVALGVAIVAAGIPLAWVMQ